MNYTLHCGDCLDYLKTLDACSVDAVITDPPFGIGFKYASHNDTPEGYGEWLWRALESAEALCKPGAPLFVWQAMLNVRNFAAWFPREWRIFAACKNFVQMRPTAMQYSFDPVVVWWTEGRRWSAGTLTRDYHVADTRPARRKPGSPDRAKGHPCPRPLGQVQHIVEQWTPPGGVVLDPFMGSGTTGVACMQTGRNFIGCEISEEYYRIAEKRIREAASQLRIPFDSTYEDDDSSRTTVQGSLY